MPPRKYIQPRNVRDVVIEDLQRELQQLQQRLAQLEHQENDREVDEAENVNEEPGDDEMGDNLFYRDYSEEESPRRANNRRFHRGADVRRVPNRLQRLDMGYVRDLGIKVDIPEFDGRLDPDEFCEWLLSVERALDFTELPPERIVKVVAVKLTKHASLWWENLKRTRNREGKKKINSWPKMKKYLQRKYLPDHYRQDLFLKLHHLKQENRSMNVERQQAAPRKVEIRASVVETQNYRNRGLKKPCNVRNYQATSGLSNNQGSTNPPRNAQYITRKCSKCQGFGHIDSNCPNGRVITVVEEMDEVNEKSKVSSVLLESNPKGSSGCNSLLQRALVRSYGAGNHVTSQLDDHHFMHTKGGHWQSDHIQSSYSSTREEYNKPFVKMSHFEAVVERQPDESFLSRKHLNEGKIINEFNMKNSSYNITIYGRTDGYAIRSSQSHFLKQEPYNSHSLEASLNSSLGGSYQLPQMDFRLSRAGTSPTSCSTKKTEYLEGHSWLEIDRRYQRSGSISNTINSSSYHPCPELRIMVHQNIPSDLACRQTTKIQYDDWEPSQPFRPSWAIATKRTSSPSQYDPILDSIKPPTAKARDCFQSSQMSPFQNVSLLPSKIENAISWEGMLAKNASLHDSSAHAAADVFVTSTKLEGANNSGTANTAGPFPSSAPSTPSTQKLQFKEGELVWIWLRKESFPHGSVSKLRSHE